MYVRFPFPMYSFIVEFCRSRYRRRWEILLRFSDVFSSWWVRKYLPGNEVYIRGRWQTKGNILDESFSYCSCVIMRSSNRIHHENEQNISLLFFLSLSLIFILSLHPLFSHPLALYSPTHIFIYLSISICLRWHWLITRFFQFITPSLINIEIFHKCSII